MLDIVNVNRYFTILVMAIALLQPVVAGAHLVHLDPVQAAGHHAHSDEQDTTRHPHFHHQSAHVDLTYDCLNLMVLGSPAQTTNEFIEHTFHFPTFSLSPDNPPPILA